MDDLIAYLLC